MDTEALLQPTDDGQAVRARGMRPLAVAGAALGLAAFAALKVSSSGSVQSMDIDGLAQKSDDSDEYVIEDGKYRIGEFEGRNKPMTKCWTMYGGSLVITKCSKHNKYQVFEIVNTHTVKYMGPGVWHGKCLSGNEKIGRFVKCKDDDESQVYQFARNKVFGEIRNCACSQGAGCQKRCKSDTAKLHMAGGFFKKVVLSVSESTTFQWEAIEPPAEPAPTPPPEPTCYEKVEDYCTDGGTGGCQGEQCSNCRWNGQIDCCFKEMCTEGGTGTGGCQGEQCTICRNECCQMEGIPLSYDKCGPQKPPTEDCYDRVMDKCNNGGRPGGCQGEQCSYCEWDGKLECCFERECTEGGTGGCQGEQCTKCKQDCCQEEGIPPGYHKCAPPLQTCYDGVEDACTNGGNGGGCQGEQCSYCKWDGMLACCEQAQCQGCSGEQCSECKVQCCAQNDIPSSYHKCQHPDNNPPSVCSANGEDCRQTECCSEAGMTCFKKNDHWASCNKTFSHNMLWVGFEESHTGWEKQDEKVWDCEVLSEKPACTGDGEDCRESRCCSKEGSTCFRKSDHWAECKPSCNPHDQHDGECQKLECVDDTENCMYSGCCNMPGETCFRKDAHWATCNATCSPNMLWVHGEGWVEQDHKVWDCEVLTSTSVGVR